MASHNKKLFQINKAFQIAQAIMQTYQGATLAPELPSTLIVCYGSGSSCGGSWTGCSDQSSVVRGGWFHWSGARAGGSITRAAFGYASSGGEIIDHRKGGGAGITIINNVDATGAGSDVDMKIRQAMQQTSEQTVVIVQDLLRRRRMA